MKNSNDTIGNRNRDLPACSAVPQPTLLKCHTENIPVIDSPSWDVCWLALFQGIIPAFTCRKVQRAVSLLRNPDIRGKGKGLRLQTPTAYYLPSFHRSFTV
jgi:hypothetical protein